MRSKPPGLQEYFDLFAAFLSHCRRHLKDDDWEILTRRIRSTSPDERVHGAWTADDFVKYYWPKLTPAERDAYVRTQRRDGEVATRRTEALLPQVIGYPAHDEVGGAIDRVREDAHEALLLLLCQELLAASTEVLEGLREVQEETLREFGDQPC